MIRIPCKKQKYKIEPRKTKKFIKFYQAERNDGDARLPNRGLFVIRNFWKMKVASRILTPNNFFQLMGAAIFAAILFHNVKANIGRNNALSVIFFFYYCYPFSPYKSHRPNSLKYFAVDVSPVWTYIKRLFHNWRTSRS